MISRPRLFAAGESLGSFGGETAFSGENDLSNCTGGTLFAGNSGSARYCGPIRTPVTQVVTHRGSRSA